MIYTLTFSPAVDYIVKIDEFKTGIINRTTEEAIYPGGKGINVSLVLANLNRESIATGFIGGFTGNFIEEELDKQNIKTDFIHIEDNTRINVKIRGSVETAINGKGPKISFDKIKELSILLSKLNNGDILVISGNVIPNITLDDFSFILDSIKDKNLQLIIDTDKLSMLKALDYQPFLVKPNKEELEALFDTKIDNDNDLINYALKLKSKGPENVIVSLGSKGAILIDKDEKVFVEPVSTNDPVVNTVGAGDSLVAGVIDEYLRSCDMVKALKWGVATGTASATSLGLAKLKDVKKYYFE